MKRKIHYIDIALRFHFRPKSRAKIIAAARKLVQENIAVSDDDDSLDAGVGQITDDEAAEHVSTVQDSIFEILAANPLLEELGLNPVESVTSREETAANYDAAPGLQLGTTGRTLVIKALSPEYSALMEETSRGIRRRSAEFEVVPGIQQELEEQLLRFREKFGREMGPDDPLFFDPEADEPKPMDLSELDAEITDTMVRAGVDPAKIYAYKKTGMMASHANWNKWTDKDRAGWNAAIAEYNQLIKKAH